MNGVISCDDEKEVTAHLTRSATIRALTLGSSAGRGRALATATTANRQMTQVLMAAETKMKRNVSIHINIEIWPGQPVFLSHESAEVPKSVSIDQDQVL
jgi:hypothetical protein